MRWCKLGMLYCPDGSVPWMRSHAALPFPVNLQGDLFRIFFSARDGKQCSHIGFVDVEIGMEPKLHRVSSEAVLAPGPAGSFDDSGIGLGCIVGSGEGARLYYMGWNLGTTAPWHNSIGLALGDPRVPAFARYAAGPIMDRSPLDPYTLSYPWVLRDGGVWHMWYGSNLSWGVNVSDMSHAIKRATSADGIAWTREEGVAIGPDGAGTYALARPSVVKDNGLFRMWYAYRGDAYRIGYAESDDGAVWIRKDAEAGIAPSDSGWDSEMICYPCVFDHAGTRFLLYNGNRYGATGFGIAVLENP